MRESGARRFISNPLVTHNCASAHAAMLSRRPGERLDEQQEARPRERASDVTLHSRSRKGRGLLRRRGGRGLLFLDAGLAEFLPLLALQPLGVGLGGAFHRFRAARFLGFLGGGRGCRCRRGWAPWPWRP